MLSLFSSSSNKGASRPRYSSDQVASSRKPDDSNVLYAAKNKSKGITFMCSAPPDSEHAAEALRISSKIFEGKSRRHEPRLAIPGSHATEDRHRAIQATPAAMQTTGEEVEEIIRHAPPSSSRHQPEAVVIDRIPIPGRTSRSRHSVPVVGVELEDNDDDEDDISDITVSDAGSRMSGLMRRHFSSRKARHDRREHGSGSGSGSSELTATVVPPQQSEVTAVQSRHAVAAAAGEGAATGFRHSSRTHTAYFLRRDEREIYVSAPKGSNEARVFDETAQKVVAGGGLEIGSKNRHAGKKYLK